MQTLFDLLDKLIQSTDKIAGLSTASFALLIAFAEGYYIYRVHRDDKISSEKWRITREEAVKAEIAQTESIARIADNVIALASAHNNLIAQVNHLATLVDERIPRRP